MRPNNVMPSRLRASVLGGVDGVISSFAVVASSHAQGSNPIGAVLVIGISTVIADALSMGVSEYLSTSAELAASKAPSRQKDSLLLGLSCFAAFVVCGAIPVLTYAVTDQNLVSSSMFSLATLIVLGAARSYASGETLLYTVFQTMILGAAAGSVAYGVGQFVESQVSE